MKRAFKLASAALSAALTLGFIVAVIYITIHPVESHASILHKKHSHLAPTSSVRPHPRPYH